MARRATVIKNERAINPGIVLVLDAGNALMGAYESSRSRGQVTVDFMNLLGYDAMTLGRMDFAAGLEALTQRQAEANFPFLSANVVTREGVDVQLDPEPYIIIERLGKRIAVLGLSENEATIVSGIDRQVTVRDAIEVAGEIVPELREQVDLLIVLSHLGLDRDAELAKAVEGIDIIIGGNTRKLMREPQREGNTFIIQQGYRGEWIGRFQVTYDLNGVPAAVDTQVITLDPKIADDPEILQVVARYKEMYPQPTPLPQPTVPSSYPKPAGPATPALRVVTPYPEPTRS